MGVVLVFHGRGGPLRLTNSPWTGHPPLSGLPGWFLALKHPPVHVGLITRHGFITVIIIAIRCMEAPENCCAFCAGSCTLRLRCNLSTILRSGGPLCSFLRTIWPALWRQLLASTHTVYVCLLFVLSGTRHQCELFQFSETVHCHFGAISFQFKILSPGIKSNSNYFVFHILGNILKHSSKAQWLHRDSK